MRVTLRYMITEAKTLLDDLHQTRCFTLSQGEQVSLEKSGVRMDFSAFQTNLHHVSLFIYNFCLFPLNSLSHRLYRIDAIKLCAQEFYLRSTTLFASVHIEHLCTVFLQEETIQALERFLNIYLPKRHIYGIIIETVIKFFHLILANQLFIHNDNLY